MGMDDELNSMLAEVGGPCNYDNMIMNFGDKMTQDEIDDIYGEFDFDDNKDIMTKSVVDLFVAGAMDEKKEEEEEKKEEEAPAGEGGEEGATKKKKKKKKAAK